MRGIVFLVLSLLVLAAVPAIFQESYTRHLFILAMIYAIVASNWDLSLGYTGIFNFGHMAFFAVDVYTAAIAAKTFGVNPWLTLPLSGATAAITALILAAPLARLKGIYVVLVTFAFRQLLLQLVLSQSQITGGAEGMVRIPPMTLGSYKFIRDFKFGYFYIALTLLTLSSVYLLLLTRSTFGRALLAVRDSEDYANARGISISRMRVLAHIKLGVIHGADWRYCINNRPYLRSFCDIFRNRGNGWYSRYGGNAIYHCCSCNDTGTKICTWWASTSYRTVQPVKKRNVRV